MTQKPFEDFLKSKAEEFQPKPNPNNWDKIAAALPPEKKKRRLAFWIPIGIAASIAIYTASILFIPKTQNEVIFNTINEKIYTEKDPVLKKSTSVLSSSNITSQQTTNNTSSNTTEYNNTLYRSSISSESKQFSSQPLNNHLSKSNANVAIEDRFSTPNNLIFENTFEDTSKTNLGYTEIQENNNLDNNISSLISSIDTTNVKKKIMPDSSINKYRIAEHHHFITTQFSPIFITTILSKPNATGSNTIEYNNRRKEDNARFSFSTGVSYKYQHDYSKHAFEIGLMYTQLSYSMNVANITSSSSVSGINRLSNFDYNASDSFITSPSIEGGGRVINTYKYLSLPIVYNRKINIAPTRNSYSISFNTGIVFNYLISQSGLLNQSNGLYVKARSSEENNITKQHFSLLIGFQYAKKIGSNTYFVVSPQFQRALSYIEKGSISTSYASWGLGFGLQIKLH